MSRLVMTNQFSAPFSGSRVSVSIEGFESFSLGKGDSRTLDLEDGSYTIVLRSFMNKRTVYLKLQGDDSFYIVSDYATGGIILANSLDKKATMCPRFRRLDLAAICLSLALSFVLYSLGAAGIIPHEIGSWGFLIFAGTLAASLGCMLALNSVPIIRERRVGFPWIC